MGGLHCILYYHNISVKSWWSAFTSTVNYTGMYSITYYYKDKTTDLNKEFDKLYQILLSCVMYMYNSALPKSYNFVIIEMQI